MSIFRRSKGLWLYVTTPEGKESSALVFEGKTQVTVHTGVHQQEHPACDSLEQSLRLSELLEAAGIEHSFGRCGKPGNHRFHSGSIGDPIKLDDYREAMAC